MFVFSEVMDLLQETLPPLENIIEEIDQLAESGGKYIEAPHVIEVTLPMVCRYAEIRLLCWMAHHYYQLYLGIETNNSYTEKLQNQIHRI